jgi:uncharacterized membrane protein (UPF0127 family)
MKAYVYNKIIINNLIVAKSFIAKLVGLLNKKNINDEGLLLMNCSSIHCFFMKFTIDVVYLSSDMQVLDKETVDPWKIGKFVKKAKHVLELPEGAAKVIMIGDMIEIRE